MLERLVSVSSSIIPSFVSQHFLLDLSLSAVHIFQTSSPGFCLACAHKAPLYPLTHIRLLFLCLVFVFLSLILLFFSSLEKKISSTQSLLGHGSRCSLRYLLHSACSPVRNPLTAAQCISPTRRPSIHTTAASGHVNTPREHL